MSLLGGILGGGGSDTSAQRKKMAELAARERELGDGLVGALREADRSGVWDPNAALDRLRADTEYQTKVNSGNAAAASRVLGYRPGDTAPVEAQRAIGDRAKLDYADQAAKIREGSVIGRLSAYNQTSANAAGIYGQGANVYGNVADLAQRDAQSGGGGIGGLLGAISPFLMPQAPAMRAAARSTGFSLGTPPARFAAPEDKSHRADGLY